MSSSKFRHSSAVRYTSIVHSMLHDHHLILKYLHLCILHTIGLIATCRASCRLIIVYSRSSMGESWRQLSAHPIICVWLRSARARDTMWHPHSLSTIEWLRVGHLAGTVHDQGEGEERSVDQQETIEHHFLEDNMPIIVFSCPDPRCSAGVHMINCLRCQWACLHHSWCQRRSLWHNYDGNAGGFISPVSIR